MPTIHREDGFRFFFYSNERSEPAHIHVEHGDGVAKFWLLPVTLENAVGLNARQLRRAREIVEENAAMFREAWNEHFNA